MGNRAVITVGRGLKSDPAIYVHWNGGRASVQGFLDACKELGFRSPGGDTTYAMGYLATAIGLYFGSGISFGIGTVGNLDADNGDNGTYLIGGNWEIVGRKHSRGIEEIDQVKTDGICRLIVRKFIAAKEVTDEE